VGKQLLQDQLVDCLCGAVVLLRVVNFVLAEVLSDVIGEKLEGEESHVG